MTLPLMKALTLRSGERPMINESRGPDEAETGHAPAEGGTLPEGGTQTEGGTLAKRGALAMLVLGACMVAGRILLQRKAR